MKQRKVKIISTIGPSSDSLENMLALAIDGLDLVRINFSHGTYKEHQQKFENIDRIYEKTGIILSVMCDLSGPKVRCHDFIDGEVLLEKDNFCNITMTKTLGNKDLFSVNYKGLYDDVNINDILTLDDGNLSLKIEDKMENKILKCKIMNTHILKNHKGLNAPNINLNNEYLSKKDKEDIEFIINHDVSYIAISFVRNENDINDVKKFINNLTEKEIKIVSKIENMSAVNNIDKIIEFSDAIMIARGDLGVEVKLEDVPAIQKMIINKCNISGKPVIVATHMLESMQNSINPTRAEVSDVFNAVIDGCDAVMLSSETAIGKYPLQSLRMQSRIVIKAEEILDYENFSNRFFQSSNKSQGDAIGISVAITSTILDIKAVFMIANSYLTISKLSKFKIKAPIVAIVKNISDAKILNGLYYGMNSVVDDKIFYFDQENKETKIKEIAKQFGINKDDSIILVSEDIQLNKSNAIKILQVD